MHLGVSTEPGLQAGDIRCFAFSCWSDESSLRIAVAGRHRTDGGDRCVRSCIRAASLSNAPASTTPNGDTAR